MALVNCPECARQISDKAKFCPNCGFKATKKWEEQLNAGIDQSKNIFNIYKKLTTDLKLTIVAPLKWEGRSWHKNQIKFFILTLLLGFIAAFLYAIIVDEYYYEYNQLARMVGYSQRYDSDKFFSYFLALFSSLYIGIVSIRFGKMMHIVTISIVACLFSLLISGMSIKPSFVLQVLGTCACLMILLKRGTVSPFKDALKYSILFYFIPLIPYTILGLMIGEIDFMGISLFIVFTSTVIQTYLIYGSSAESVVILRFRQLAKFVI